MWNGVLSIRITVNNDLITMHACKLVEAFSEFPVAKAWRVARLLTVGRTSSYGQLLLISVGS